MSATRDWTPPKALPPSTAPAELVELDNIVLCGPDLNAFAKLLETNPDLEVPDEFAIPAKPKHYSMKCEGGHFKMEQAEPVLFPSYGTAGQTQP